MDTNISLAGKIYLYAGKLPFLKSGFSLFKTPTGENINSQKLAEIIIIATLYDLIQRNVIEMREEQGKALLGSFPVLVFKKTVLEDTETGFSKILLGHLTSEKELVNLTADLIGRRMMIPEFGVINHVEDEFRDGFFEIVEVKKFFGAVRKEKVWNMEKVSPIIENTKGEVEKFIGSVSTLPWFNTALRNIHLGFSEQRVQPKHDD